MRLKIQGKNAVKFHRNLENGQWSGTQYSLPIAQLRFPLCLSPTRLASRSPEVCLLQFESRGETLSHRCGHRPPYAGTVHGRFVRRRIPGLLGRKAARRCTESHSTNGHPGPSGVSERGSREGLLQLTAKLRAGASGVVCPAAVSQSDRGPASQGLVSSTGPGTLSYFCYLFLCLFVCV